MINKTQQQMWQVAALVILASLLMSLMASGEHRVQAQEVTEEPSPPATLTQTAAAHCHLSPLYCWVELLSF